MSLSGRGADMTLPDILTNQQKAGYDLDFEGRTICIDFRQSEFLARAVASDSCRFMCASFQTLASIAAEMVEDHSLPWGLIKLYYAAFYAGHSLVRLFGESCSHFDYRHAFKINTLASSMGKLPFRIERGLYHCVIADSAAGMRATLLLGSSHQSFWRVFGEWLKSTIGKISLGPLSPNEVQEVVLKLEALRDTVQGGELSIVRNSLQYRHLFGVWSPAKLPKRDREALGRLMSQWKRDPMTIDLRAPNIGELGEFVLGCAFIIALCRTLLRRIAERSTAHRPFVCFGPLDLLVRRIRQPTLKRAKSQN